MPLPLLLEKISAEASFVFIHVSIVKSAELGSSTLLAGSVIEIRSAVATPDIINPPAPHFLLSAVQPVPAAWSWLAVEAKLVRVPLQAVVQEPEDEAVRVVPEVSLKSHCATKELVLYGCSPLPVFTPPSVQLTVFHGTLAAASTTGEV